MEILEIGEYRVPDDCTMKIKGKILRVVKCKDNRVHEQRCRDCVFFAEGYTRKVATWRSVVCLKKPKNATTCKGDPMYFSVTPYGMICQHFEPKKYEERY